MAPSRRVRPPGRAGARYSKNTVGRTHSTKKKTGQKHKPPDVFDFPDSSDASSIGELGENEKDEEPYETFDPPLHSTAIYADEEEFSKHCGSSIPSTPQGKEAKRSSNTSEIEASENESVIISARKSERKRKPISDESESSEESDIRRKVKPAEKTSPQQPEAVPAAASSEPAEKPGASVTRTKKTQRKEKMFHGKRKKPRRESIDSDISDCVHIWCLKGKKTSDIMELDVVLSAFEKTLLEYKQKIGPKICKEAIDKFHSHMREELITMIKEVQMLKTLKRKNAKVISDTEKKRQRLIEIQDELLRTIHPAFQLCYSKQEPFWELKTICNISTIN
ncbi:centromere protein U isoform X2 [Diceros bicornis minor]|uniref:centromere protein U isoform X2 n=1 Tax=Diceros bicornis minor TaxID=77932 RepID=UPI0026E92EA0|nr:centromere protein U isoform X2 [Diceros bicornis minor]